MLVNEFYDEQVAYLQTWIEKFTNTASGLEVDHCIKLYLNIAKYEPLKGSSYIDLPKVIKDKKAIINVKNKDDACLFRAIVSALYPTTNHSDRPSSYPDYKGIICTNGIDIPTPINQINKLEKQNENLDIGEYKGLAINVYGYTISKKKEILNVFPYYISDQPHARKRINLLLICEDVEEETDNYPEKQTKYHYCWIKNLNG